MPISTPPRTPARFGLMRFGEFRFGYIFADCAAWVKETPTPPTWVPVDPCANTP